MLLATRALLAPVLARVFFVLATGGGPGLRPGLGHPIPVGAALEPAICVLLLVACIIVYEWRTRGRPHSVWLIGAVILAAVYLGFQSPISSAPKSTPIRMSVRRDMPRHVTMVPGGGSLALAR